MERREIAKGVFYTSFDTNHKKQRLSIHIKVPLERESITETALLPYMLERGSAAYPDMTELKRRLNMLFGASLYTSVSSVDYARVLTLTTEGIDAKFLDDKDVSQNRVDLLLDMLFNPVAADGAFRADWLDIEREKLRFVIQNEINDKRGYCLRMANERFFDNDVRALPQNGFIEDLDGIDGKRLFEVYLAMLRDCTVEVVNIGSHDDALEARLAAAFSGRARSPRTVPEKRAMPYGEVKEGRLQFDVEQDKYAMILTAGRLLSEREQSVLRIANLIFGSSPTSRLFMNVREKQSLCYYCASRPGFMTGALTVDSGLEHENIEKLRAAVLAELADLAAGNIGDRELDEAKLMLKNALVGVEDTVEGIAGWYVNAIYRVGRPVTPEEEIAISETVTKEEVAAVLGLFKTKVTMLLSDREA